MSIAALYKGSFIIPDKVFKNEYGFNLVKKKSGIEVNNDIATIEICKELYHRSSTKDCFIVDNLHVTTPPAVSYDILYNSEKSLKSNKLLGNYSFLYNFNARRLVPIPKDSRFFTNAIEDTKTYFNKIESKDYLPGHIYLTRQGHVFIYLGEVFTQECKIIGSNDSDFKLKLLSPTKRKLWFSLYYFDSIPTCQHRYDEKIKTELYWFNFGNKKTFIKDVGTITIVDMNAQCALLRQSAVNNINHYENPATNKRRFLRALMDGSKYLNISGSNQIQVHELIDTYITDKYDKLMNMMK